VNDILKQRLVGALILVALGVVFWPIIFVEPGDKAVAQQTRIPPRPDVVTTPIEVPDLAGLRASPERAPSGRCRRKRNRWNPLRQNRS
jgi:DedD protein